jgi:C8 domain
LTKSDNEIANHEEDFVASWGIQKTCINDFRENLLNNNSLDYLKDCELFFKQKTSYFATCFTVVDPDPFFAICLSLHRSSKTSEKSTKAACTSGLSYIEACSIKNVPLRIPDSCIK